MTNPTINLIPFTREHFDTVAREVPTQRLITQWAGTKYRRPLTWPQMESQIVDKGNDGRFSRLFSVCLAATGAIVGHIQLKLTEPDTAEGKIGSVLICADYRGQGLGRQAVGKVLELGFMHYGLERIVLGAFDFNTPAIRCYTALGFTPYETCLIDTPVDGEQWTLIRMELRLHTYRNALR